MCRGLKRDTKCGELVEKEKRKANIVWEKSYETTRNGRKESSIIKEKYEDKNIQ